MNILYNKVALTSACTVLSFVLGVSPHAKAASFTFTAASTFVLDVGFDGADLILPAGLHVGKATTGETASSMEFNIGSLFMEPNTIITKAIFEAQIDSLGNFFFNGET